MGTRPTVHRDLVVIGASGGGIHAIKRVVGRLPRDFGAAVVVVLHQWGRGPNILVDILNHIGTLPAVEASNGMAVRPGTVYVPPVDHHILVDEGVFQVARGPRENHARPAVDPLFRSAARVYGPRVIGVILTGSLDDGTAGLLAIKRRGGVAVVQDPAEALYPGMPQSALDHVQVDHRVHLEAIAPLLVELTRVVVAGEPARSATGDPELREQQGGTTGMEPVKMVGKPSYFSCPACHGVLWEVDDGDLIRFRCHTGHAYGLESLVSGKDQDVEGALWAAMRALKEKAEVNHRMAVRADERGHAQGNQRHLDEVAAIERQIEQLRSLIDSV